MKRKKRCRKIAAIDRGDKWIVAQGTQRLGVIPVVEVAAKVFEARDGGKRAQGPVGALGNG